MAQIESHDTDIKTRANLAYFWSLGTFAILAYIVVKWGDQKEILTLIIGLIGGTIIGGIFGIYFGGSITGKKPDGGITVTGDQPTVTGPVNTPANDTQTP